MESDVIFLSWKYFNKKSILSPSFSCFSRTRISRVTSRVNSSTFGFSSDIFTSFTVQGRGNINTPPLAIILSCCSTQSQLRFTVSTSSSNSVIERGASFACSSSISRRRARFPDGISTSSEDKSLGVIFLVGTSALARSRDRSTALSNSSPPREALNCFTAVEAAI